MKQIIYICLGLLLLFTSNTPIVAQEVSDYTQLSEEDYSNITLPPLSVLFENAKDNPIYEMADVKAAVTAGERKACISRILQSAGKLPIRYFRQ